MSNCYITKTGSFLPGKPVPNEAIQGFLGKCIGESWVKDKILKLNGITSRHYALNEKQEPTHDVYQLGCEAVKNCMNGSANKQSIDYLSAGSTNTPLIAPGLSSLLHDRLSKARLSSKPVEINSNSGICTSGAQAFVNAVRAVKSGDASNALSVGVEQPSAILKSKSFHPKYDFKTIFSDVRKSKWFMSVFLRFMLSDGAGAWLLQNKANREGLSFRVNWTYSRSFANEAPLCMNLTSKDLLLSQDVSLLSKHIIPCAKKALSEALSHNNESVSDYDMLLPHLSSYYFEPRMKRAIRELQDPTKSEIPFWTNLASAGNTGAASIYIMLDEFAKTQQVKDGERLLLFIPESGQFNFVIISLTAVGAS